MSVKQISSLRSQIAKLATRLQNPSGAMTPEDRESAYAQLDGLIRKQRTDEAFALVADLPEDEARRLLGSQPLPARTALTLTEPEAIMARLAQVRAQGFEVIDQEVEMGLRSIAVPLMNARGQVVAALNVGVAPVQKSTEDLQAQFLPALQQAQATLRPMLA